MSKLRFALLLIRLGLTLMGRAQVISIENQGNAKLAANVKAELDGMLEEMVAARDALDSLGMPEQSGDPYQRD